MDVSFFIASRLRFKGRTAIVCIVVSFLVMIVAVAVSSGFRNEIRNALADLSGDIQITPVDMNYIGGTSPIERHPAYMSKILELPQVREVRPVVYRAGIVKSGDNIHGVLFKGSEQKSGADSLGSLEVSIPTRLSSMLSLAPGDDMTAYFVGERVKARRFKVASLYNPLVQTDDKIIVLGRLDDLQRVNDWDGEEVSAFELSLTEGSRNPAEIEDLGNEVGFIAYSYADEDEATVVSTSAVRKYPQLFDWLNLIDFNVLFILVLMTLVAGFNMISGLLIMLFENISTIGLLKSLGMTDRKIARVFLTASSGLILRGMVIGNLLAFGLCLLENLTHLVKLDPVNYFVSYVPTHINVWAVLGADLAAYALIMLLLLIPSMFISRIDPAKTVAVR